MFHQTWKTLTIVFTALLVSFYYYFQFSHGESAKGLLLYLFVITFFYLCYKAYYIFLEYEKIEFGIGKILLFTLLHLFFLCVFLFLGSGLSVTYAFIFFSKLSFFLFLVIGLHTLIYLFGRSILGYILHPYEAHSLKDRGWNMMVNTITHTTLLSKKEQVLVSFALGSIIFFFSLSFLAFSHLYTLTSLFFLFGIFFIFSFREIIPTWKDIQSISWSFENHNFGSSDSEQFYRPYLLSTEFLFLVVTGIISVNFISVFRPFPIGWDDLGVYMNYPKLLAGSFGNIALGSMYPWQLYTGIGYLFHSQTFAFLLNSFAAVMSFFVVSLGISSLLPENKRSFFNIPLLSATLFLGLPMVIFQTAKDMKLDIGLFALSFLAIILLYILYTSLSRFNKKHIMLLLFIIGALAGLAFSIKVTSLLLISAIFGVIFYAGLGYLGFLSYIFFYISIFTFFGLWGVMNVIFPGDNPLLVNGVSFGFLLLSGISFFFSYLKKNGDIKKTLIHSCIFLLGVVFSFLPWGLKNISELSNISELTIYRLIGGKAVYFAPNYLEIYDAKTYAQKKDLLQNQKLDENGNTKNEDMGRYFGYESGINNYLKLPWNLTMQVNQKGEFTDIGFFFLALLPSIFLLLPSRKKYFSSSILGILILSFFYFIPSPLAKILNHIGDIFILPFGYLVILVLYLVGTTFLILSVDKKNKTMEIFFLNLIFTSFFVFLWTISAFGVVWYGITMYGSFLLMIGISYSELCSYDEKEGVIEKEKKLQNSFLIFCIFLIYIFISIIPRYIGNLQTSGFMEYKIGQYSENRSIFASHPEYLTTLFTLNIDDSKKETFISQYKAQIFEVLSIYKMNQEAFTYLDSIKDISGIESFLLQIGALKDDTPLSNLPLIQKNTGAILEKLYTDIIYPNEDIDSKQKIFKIGTFMKYFISKNNQRVHDDGLLTDFDAYVYDVNPNITAERLKKLEIGYFLVDLNAATIDNDPRRDLTRRYENLLTTVVGEKFQLIESDSICLKVALDDYKDTQDIEAYALRAGVNYESYLSDGVVLQRGEKLNNCHTRIIEILRDTTIDKNQKYTYLLPVLNYLAQNGKNLDDEGVMRDILMKFGVGYKALFKIQ